MILVFPRTLFKISYFWQLLPPNPLNKLFYVYNRYFSFHSCRSHAPFVGCICEIMWTRSFLQTSENYECLQHYNLRSQTGLSYKINFFLFYLQEEQTLTASVFQKCRTFHTVHTQAQIKYTNNDFPSRTVILVPCQPHSYLLLLQKRQRHILSIFFSTLLSPKSILQS